MPNFKPLIASSVLLMSTVSWANCADDYIQIDEKKNRQDGRTFEAKMWVNVPMSHLFAVISNASQHPEFVPDLAKVTVTQVDEQHSIQEQWLDLPMGKVKRYRIEVSTEQADSVARINWQLIDWPEVPKAERIVDTQGYWQLEQESPSCTKATYHVYSDPGPVPFGLGWIVDSMTEDSVPALLTAMRDRAVSTKPSP